MTLAKWELEDELRAIEELLTETRLKNVAIKRKGIGTEDDTLPPEERSGAAGKRFQAKAAKSRKA